MRVYRFGGVNTDFQNVEETQIDDKSINIAETLSVFAHTNYREYLGQWFLARKKIQSNYSGAMFAKKAGLNSHSLLGMVIRGDRNLSPTTCRSFIRALGIRGKEAIYFENLVWFNQSKNSDDRAYYFDKLSAVNSGGKEPELVTKLKNYAPLFSHWYVVAIKQLIELEDFIDDPKWIAEKLKNKITKRQAESALNLLFDAGMVSRDDQKPGLKVEERPVDVAPDGIDFVMRNFHKEFLDRIKESVDGETIEERELSSLSLSIDDQDWPKILDRIREFRKSLNIEFSKPTKPKSRVIAVNMQALVLTTGETK